MFILKRNTKLIEKIDKQIKECLKAIEKLLASDAALQSKAQKIATIKGVGLITIATVIAETNGFEGFSSAKQLASFAGYDVVQRESEHLSKAKQGYPRKETDIYGMPYTSRLWNTKILFSSFTCFL